MHFRSILSFAIIHLALSLSLFSQSSEDQLAFAFRSQGSLNPERMIIVGDVVGVEKASFFEVDQVSAELGVDARPDAVTIKVRSPKGLRPGQILYLLEKNLDHKTYRDGNIVAMITVKSVFQTTFFGWQVRGEGYLRLIEDRPMTAALPIDTTRYEEAFLAKKQADYFVTKGKLEEAIHLYKKSISLDPKHPDTHFALGKVHFQDGEGYVSAGYEYNQAWMNRERFSNSQEKLLFLLEYMRFLIYQYKLEGKGGEKGIEKLPLVAKEAQALAPKNFEVWLYNFETAYIHYMRANLLTIGVDARKSKEEWSDAAEYNLERAMILRKADFYLQRLACEFYNTKWKETRGTPLEKKFRDKLVEHGKLLKTFYTGETTISIDLLKSIHEAEKQSGLL
jgi:hypothetical protein